MACMRPTLPRWTYMIADAGSCTVHISRLSIWTSSNLGNPYQNLAYPRCPYSLYFGFSGHPAVVRRQCAVDQQRHVAGRRLDRDAPGRRRRRCGGHHAAYGQGADLRVGLLPAVLGTSHIPEAEKHVM